MARIKSFGAEVYINGLAVGGLTDISATGTDVAFLDTSSHDVAGGFKTFVAGLKDGGNLELTGKYNYGDSGQAEWKAEEGVSHAFYIILSDNSGFAFNAIVGGFQTSNPLDDAVEFTATAKITGPVYPVFPTMTVTGTLTSDGLTPVVFDPIPFYEISEGRSKYLKTSPAISVLFDGTVWELNMGSPTVRYGSTAPVLTPDQVSAQYPGAWHATTNPHGWKPDAPATGTPTITGS